MVDLESTINGRDNVPPGELGVAIQGELRVARKGRLQDPVELLEVVPLILADYFPSAPPS